jgi:hypothetical protein
MKQTKQDPGVRAFICASRSLSHHQDTAATVFVYERQPNKRFPYAARMFLLRVTRSLVASN